MGSDAIPLMWLPFLGLTMFTLFPTATCVPAPRFSLGICGSSFGSVSDVTGNGHTVSIIPSGATGISVISDYERGNCLSRAWDASASSAVLISSSAPSASYTKSVWAKLTNLTSLGYQNIMSNTGSGEPAGSHFLFTYPTGDVSNGHNQDGTGRTSTVDSVVLERPGWVHVAATFDATTQLMITYQNGQETSRASWTSGSAKWDGTTSLQTQLLNWNTYGFVGCIADINLYDSALSANDVKTLYNQQSANTVCGISVQTHQSPVVNITDVMVPHPKLAVGVCGINSVASMSIMTDVVDVTNQHHNVFVNPSSNTGFSVVDSGDSVRGIVMSSTGNGTSGAGVMLGNSRLSASYTKSAMVKLSNPLNWFQFMASQPNLYNDVAGTHAFFYGGSAPNQGLCASHNQDGTGGRRLLCDTTPIATNTWTHIAVTYNNNTNAFTLYQNGVQTATGGTGSSVVWTGTTSSGTQLFYYQGYTMSGSMTDVVIWDVALNSTQVSHVYSRLMNYSVCDPGYYGESNSDWCNNMAASYNYSASQYQCTGGTQQFTNVSYEAYTPLMLNAYTSSLSYCRSGCLNLGGCGAWSWDLNHEISNGVDNVYNCNLYSPLPNREQGATVAGVTSGRVCQQDPQVPKQVPTILQDKWLATCI